jgi:hypothetical protein
MTTDRAALVEAMARALAYVEEKAGYPDHDADGVWLRLRESSRAYWRESAIAALEAHDRFAAALTGPEAGGSQWRAMESAPVSTEALHLRQWFLISLRVQKYQSQKWCVGFCELDDDGERRYVNESDHTIDWNLNHEEAIAWMPIPGAPAPPPLPPEGYVLGPREAVGRVLRDALTVAFMEGCDGGRRHYRGVRSARLWRCRVRPPAQRGHHHCVAQTHRNADGLRPPRGRSS